MRARQQNTLNDVRGCRIITGVRRRVISCTLYEMSPIARLLYIALKKRYNLK